MSLVKQVFCTQNKYAKITDKFIMTESLKLENQLCHRLYTLSNALSRAYRPLLQHLDITYPQYVVMMALWEQDDVFISTLLARTRIDGGAMTQILKKLQQKDLLNVSADERDKRSRRVRLSPAGHAARAHAEAVPEQMLCHLSGLSETEVAQLRHLLDKLAHSLRQ